MISATSAARADVEDRDPIPPPASSVAAGLAGHAGRYLGQSEGGWGPFIELAAGRGRWQYFVEGTAMRLEAGDSDAPTRKGMFLRGGVGARWLARSFMLDDKGSIDMHLEAFTGLGQLRWEHGEHVMRPDLGFGVGYDVRLFSPWKLTFRVSARIFFAPHDHSAAPTVACHASTTCSMDGSQSSSSGLIAMFGFAW